MSKQGSLRFDIKKMPRLSLHFALFRYIVDIANMNVTRGRMENFSRNIIKKKVQKYVYEYLDGGKEDEK